MTQYIDKSAIVAEIERKRNDYINSFMTEQVHVLNDVLDFIDNLEMKEINSADAFIKKAEEFFYSALNDGIMDTCDIENFIRLFENHMKEEIK